MEEYPRVNDLARANPRKLGCLLRPLGIRTRVFDLVETAKSVVSQCDGRIPDNYEMLVAFPGVGRYIANSVLVRAYGAHLPLVDSNVNRVLGRVFLASNRMSNKEAEDLFIDVSRYANSGALSYAIIDLAHSICVSRTAKCPICPVKNVCAHLHAPRVKGKESGRK